jgi:UDP-N-acetylmuramate--alanine ligase
LSAALAAGVPVVKRAQFLGTLMAERIGVAIAGTHGKTTTTAMIATTLLAAGRDPDFIVGGIVPGLESGAHAGHGDAFVIEADEYDRMFLGLSPQIAIITNVEWDHVDCYPTAHDFAEAFAAFADRLPADGLLIACADDAGALQIARRRQKSELPVVTYAIDCEASWQAGDLRVNADGGSDFAAWHEGQRMADVSLRIPGRHNVSNALAALAAACTLGVPPEITVANLKDFAGVRRRFEVKGMCRDIIVIDDYAHHPREVQATLAAARQRYPQHGIWALFQPHTYSRTRALLADFEDSFADADHVLVTDIYASRERDTLGMHASQLAAMVAHKHPDARYIGDLDHAVAYLLENLRPGDVLLTLGAGDGNTVGERVLAAL